MSVEFRKNGIVSAGEFSNGFSNFIMRDFSAKYQQLEYLQSTGTQNININYNFNSETESFHIKFQATQRTTGMVLASCGTYYFWLYDYGANGIRIYISDTSQNQRNISPNSAIANLNEHVAIYTKKKMWLDNVEYTGSVTTSTLRQDNDSLKLFDYSTSTSYPFIGKIFYCQIFNSDGVLVRNLLPAKRLSDSVLGMYDLINGVFYTNSGTGTFTAGPIVSVISQVQCSDIIEN